MDAPAMFTRNKHVPAEEEGGQQQMHSDEKPHKPVLKKVKDKVKKIKNTIAGKGHGHDNGDEHEHEHENDTGGSNSSEMDEEDAAMREAEVETGGYQEDVEDKRVMDSSPELHGAPMYDSQTIPAASKEVDRNDIMGGGLGDLSGQAASREVDRNDAPGVRVGDLGGPVVEDPAAPNSKTPTPRGGEDIGTTDVVRDFEAMAVSDDPKYAGTEKMDRDQIKETEAMPVSDGTGEEWTDAPTDAEYTGSYTDRLKNTAAGTTEYGKQLASTVYEKVAGVGTVMATKAQQITPGFGAGGNTQNDAGKRDLDLSKEGELKNATTEDAPAATTYTDKIKFAAAGTTGYGKQLASTVYEKVTPGFGAGGNAQDDAGQRDLDLSKEGGTEELKNATTEGAPGATTYTDKIKSAAAGTTGYGKQLASTVYEKVTPGFGAGGNAQDDSSTPAPMAVDAGKRDLDLSKEGTPKSYTGTEELKNVMTEATTESSPGPTYTDKIKSAAAAGTNEYGKQLASTVYEKVAGVGTAVASKAQQVMPSAGTATPGVGAQDGGPVNGQDKGVSGVTAYIAEYLRPGDEERSLSEAITGAVQQRKEGVGSTVAKAREVPAQAVTRAREAVTSLTGGNRVSETVQPTPEGNIGEGVAAEVPTLHGEEIGAARTNTNGL